MPAQNTNVTTDASAKGVPKFFTIEGPSMIELIRDAVLIVHRATVEILLQAQGSPLKHSSITCQG